MLIPFTQVDNSSTRKFGGTGLGLVITENLLKCMDSTLVIKSVENKGSIFSFDLWFPFTSEKLYSNCPSKTNFNTGDLTNVLNKQCLLPKSSRILLTEDNKINQEIIKRFLNLCNIEIDIANNGKEAINLLKNNYSYVAILMDIHMPEMDGIEATKYIRANIDSNIPIIALSAGVTYEERANYVKAGMNDFVAKPINPESLILALNRSIAGYNTNSLKDDNQTSNKVFVEEEINFSNLLIFLDGDKESAIELLQEFARETPSLLNNFINNLNSKNYLAAHKNAHKLAGMAGNLGLFKISKLSKSIEQQIISENNYNEKLVNELKDELNRIICEIESRKLFDFLDS